MFFFLVVNLSIGDIYWVSVETYKDGEAVETGFWLKAKLIYIYPKVLSIQETIKELT